MKRVVKNCLRAIVVMLLVGLSIAPAAAQGSSGLSIDPREDYDLKPGQSVSDKIPVTNLNQQLPLSLSLRVVDFTYLNNSGTPKLLLSDNAPQTLWSIKPFLTVPKTITISPGQTQEVPISINVPKNQGGGSYYSAIEYLASATDSKSVNLNASGVSLVFLNISGQAKEDMSLQSLGAYDPDDTTAGGHYVKITTTPPQEIAYTLTNKGNVTESPAGSIVLEPMYGKDNLNIGNANDSSSLALIGQTRLFTTCIETQKQTITIEHDTTTNKVCNPKPHLKIGKYTIKLDVFYGQPGKTNHEVTGTATFWYIPLWFIGAVIAVILLILLVVGYLIRRIYKAVNGSYIAGERG